MTRRTATIVVTTLLVGGAGLVGVAPSAGAASVPPMTGNVACALDGSSTFSPYVGFGRGRGDHAINPGLDSKWKVLATLSGCTGTQNGGNPKLGSIAGGDVLIKATAVDHACQKLTDHGMTLTRLRVKWKDALGRNLRISLGTGTVTVNGLYNGWQYEDPFNPIHRPGYVSPGIITVGATGTIDAAAKVFPGQTFTFAGTVDRTLESFWLPCSYDGPPLRQGISGFGFHGAQGPSSLAVG